MSINRDKPDRWKDDIACSVDMYNDWFMAFAPRAFRETRSQTTAEVKNALKATRNLTAVTPAVLRENPGILPALRMSTCPPLAADRLIGLGGISRNLVRRMEQHAKLPARMPDEQVDDELLKIGTIIESMADPDIFVWLARKKPATRTDVHRAATIVADRLCGAVANPIIRNAQEKRQLSAIGGWLDARGYRKLAAGETSSIDEMEPGRYGFRINVPVELQNTGRQLNVPVDVAVMPRSANQHDLPLLLEAKSAGDFTNVNKRRKEEAMKITQLRATYGKHVRYGLFLCGYFDTGYLGYEAAEGIDWVWEHRIDDLKHFGL